MTEEPIQVSNVGKLGPDILVYFSDGSSAIFHAKFLFDMQTHDHNVPLTVGKQGQPSKANH